MAVYPPRGVSPWDAPLKVYIDDTVSGLVGPPGPKGDTGPSNTLSISSVVTGAPGTPANVTISGVSPNQSLAFTIPEGDPGFSGVYGAVGTVPGPYPDGTVTFEY